MSHKCLTKESHQINMVSALLKNILNNKKEGPVQLGKKPQSALQQMEVQLQNERAQ